MPNRREVVSLNPPGTSYIRALIAHRMFPTDHAEAMGVLREAYPHDHDAHECLKAAQNPGTTYDANWASPLVQTSGAIEFFEYARSQSVLGKLPLRRVGFNTSIALQTAGIVYGWVGEFKPAPAGKISFSPASLGFARLSGIIPITRELFKFGELAEATVRNELSKGIAFAADSQFLDPSVAAVAQVKPASILHGLTPVQSTGASATQIASDLEDLVNVLADADGIDESTAFVMRKTDAVRLAAKRTTDGAPAFPTVTAKGGTLLGLPVVTTNAIRWSVSAGSIVALVKGDCIAYASQGVEVDTSEQASVELLDNPMGGATDLVSAWQNNLRLFKADLIQNYQRVGSTGAAYLDNVHW